jgi:hypothetical protein
MASTENEALQCVSPTVNTAETRYLEDDYSIVLLHYDEHREVFFLYNFQGTK